MKLEKHHFEITTKITESAENQERLNLVSDSLMKDRVSTLSQTIPRFTC